MRMINDYFNNAAVNVLQQADSPCAGAIKLNNDDLHSVAMTLSADSDDESVAAESDDDEEPTVHTEDIIRHVWRGVNIKYIGHVQWPTTLPHRRPMGQPFFRRQVGLMGLLEDQERQEDAASQTHRPPQAIRPRRFLQRDV